VPVKSIIRLASVLAAALPVVLAAQQTQPTAPSPQPAAAGQSPSAPKAPVVTLDDAIKLALKVQPAVVQAGANVDIAHANQRQALGNWLPSVTANSNLTRSSLGRVNSSTGQLVNNPNAYFGSVGVTASLTLFDGLQRVFTGRQMNASAASADAALVNQKFQVTLLTKQAFFNALAAVDLERVANTAVQRSQEQLKISREKLLAGTAVRSDTLQASVTMGQAQLQLLQAQATRETQEANLAHLIGFNGVVAPVGDSTTVAVTDVDTAAVRAEALKSSPVIASATAQLRAAEATVNANRTVYLPTVTASYSTQRSGSASQVWGYSVPSGVGSDTVSKAGALNIPGLSPTWNFSLSLSWPLFNGFKREATLWSALANRDAFGASAADASRSVNAQVTQYIAALEAARTGISIARASRAAAEEGLRVQRERYRLGAATIVDVLTAQQSLDQAESDAVTQRVAYQVARAQLEALVGRAL